MHNVIHRRPVMHPGATKTVPCRAQRPRAGRNILAWAGYADEFRAWEKTGCGLLRIVIKPKASASASGLLGEALPPSPVSLSHDIQREFFLSNGRNSLTVIAWLYSRYLILNSRSGSVHLLSLVIIFSEESCIPFI